MSRVSCRFRSTSWTAISRCRSELLSDRKSTRLNSSHMSISYAVFCLKKKKKNKKDVRVRRAHQLPQPAQRGDLEGHPGHAFRLGAQRAGLILRGAHLRISAH